MSVKERRIIFLSILFSIFTFWIGYSFGEGRFSWVKKALPGGYVNSISSAPAQNIDLSNFWRVWNLLHHNYLKKDELKNEDLIYGASAGLTEATGDPYTTFLTPEENKAIKAGINGEYEGIGAELGMRDNQLVIISPLEGSPAEEAGIKAGDSILEIDGESTQGITLTEAVSNIRGPAGTDITLTVLREKDREPLDIKISRGNIELETVKWEEKEEGIYYLRINRFGERTNKEWNSAVEALRKRGNLEGLVIDLRNNPGGVLDTAVYVASDFLEQGMVVVERFADGQEREFATTGSARLANVPVVVLVNKGSASASEILAAALRYHRDAKLIGQQTFGKGVIQDARDLPDGSGVHITVAEWLTPGGENIEGEGLKVDVKIEVTEEDVEEGRDPQLEKAMELLGS